MGTIVDTILARVGEMRKEAAAEQAYAEGFCKAAEAMGVDPEALYKQAAGGKALSWVLGKGKRLGELVTGSKARRLDEHVGKVSDHLKWLTGKANRARSRVYGMQAKMHKEHPFRRTELDFASRATRKGDFDLEPELPTFSVEGQGFTIRPFFKSDAHAEHLSALKDHLGAAGFSRVNKVLGKRIARRHQTELRELLGKSRYWDKVQSKGTTALGLAKRMRDAEKARVLATRLGLGGLGLAGAGAGTYEALADKDD